MQNQTKRQKIDFSGTIIRIFMKELEYSKQAYMAYESRLNIRAKVY